MRTAKPASAQANNPRERMSPTLITAILIAALLAAPVCLLVGVAAGAIITHRLSRGLAPIPQLRKGSIAKVPPKPEPEEPAYRLPRVKA